MPRRAPELSRSARKRKQDRDELDESSDRPSHRELTISGTLLLNTFESQHNSDVTRDQLIGLCVFLKVLLQWGYPIPPSAYDAFIVSYQDWCPQKRSCQFAYHVWFLKEKLQHHTPGELLDDISLQQICDENRYRHQWMEEKMESIADVQHQASL